MSILNDFPVTMNVVSPEAIYMCLSCDLSRLKVNILELASYVLDVKHYFRRLLKCKEFFCIFLEPYILFNCSVVLLYSSVFTLVTSAV